MQLDYHDRNWPLRFRILEFIASILTLTAGVILIISLDIKFYIIVQILVYSSAFTLLCFYSLGMGQSLITAKSWILFVTIGMESFYLAAGFMITILENNTIYFIEYITFSMLIFTGTVFLLDLLFILRRFYTGEPPEISVQPRLINTKSVALSARSLKLECYTDCNPECNSGGDKEIEPPLIQAGCTHCDENRQKGYICDLEICCPVLEKSTQTSLRSNNSVEVDEGIIENISCVNKSIINEVPTQTSFDNCKCKISNLPVRTKPLKSAMKGYDPRTLEELHNSSTSIPIIKKEDSVTYNKYIDQTPCIYNADNNREETCCIPLKMSSPSEDISIQNMSKYSTEHNNISQEKLTNVTGENLNTKFRSPFVVEEVKKTSSNESYFKTSKSERSHEETPLFCDEIYCAIHGRTNKYIQTNSELGMGEDRKGTNRNDVGSSKLCGSRLFKTSKVTPTDSNVSTVPVKIHKKNIKCAGKTENKSGKTFHSLQCEVCKSPLEVITHVTSYSEKSSEVSLYYQCSNTKCKEPVTITSFKTDKLPEISTVSPEISSKNISTGGYYLPKSTEAKNYPWIHSQETQTSNKSVDLISEETKVQERNETTNISQNVQNVKEIPFEDREYELLPENEVNNSSASTQYVPVMIQQVEANETRYKYPNYEENSNTKNILLHDNQTEVKYLNKETEITNDKVQEKNIYYKYEAVVKIRKPDSERAGNVANSRREKPYGPKRNGLDEEDIPSKHSRKSKK